MTTPVWLPLTPHATHLNFVDAIECVSYGESRE